MSTVRRSIFRSESWNRFIYAVWSPFYDLLVQAPFLQRVRREAIESLDLRAGERVILVGIGTGADLAFLPEGIEATGIDLSEAMLKKARRKLPIEGREIVLQQASAEELPFADAAFDAAILTLILSVVPDGRRCLRETIRVLRPGGRAVIFDKFVANDKTPSLGRKTLNLLTNLFGTDINRAFEPMMEDLPCRVVSDQSHGFGGAYRVILLEKIAAPAAAGIAA